MSAPIPPAPLASLALNERTQALGPSSSESNVLAASDLTSMVIVYFFIRDGLLATMPVILSFEIIDTVTDTKTWMCLICGWIYDEALGAPEDGIPVGTLWADVPMNWVCPECGARKEDFEMVQI